jgi:RNA polymerase subunit RPABC4/transcription elongation factor Spt4
MDQILAGIGDTIGDIIASPVVQIGARLIFLYIAVLWIATAYWAFRDMQQRSDNAILPYLVAAGIILFTPFFFIFAVWVYKIVRPHEKIGEVWERNLAEEALLAEVEAIRHCPTCERRVDDEWIICPSCRTRLNRVCPNCSRLVGLDWSLCAWCGKDFERREVAAMAAVEPLPSGLEPTGRIAAPTSGATTGIPASIQTTVRSRGGSRGSGRSAPAGDPLPER